MHYRKKLDCGWKITNKILSINKLTNFTHRFNLLDLIHHYLSIEKFISKLSVNKFVDKLTDNLSTNSCQFTD